MRSLFHRVEKPQYVSNTPPAVETTDETRQEESAETSGTYDRVFVTDKSANQKRVKKVLTPQELLARRRRQAVVTLAVSLALGSTPATLSALLSHFPADSPV
jgi:hypothetical protein